MKTYPINEIQVSEYNPREALQPGEPEYEKLKRSLQEFGVVEPLVVNTETGNLVGGHQRLAILKDLGHEKVPVVEVKLDLERERTLNLALNKISGRWDEDAVATVLKELDEGNIDLALTGFDPDEIEDLLSIFTGNEAAEFFDDLASEIVEEEEEVNEDSAYFTLTYAVTGAEREIVLAALKKAKESFGVDTSPAALVSICQSYREGEE